MNFRNIVIMMSKFVSKSGDCAADVIGNLMKNRISIILFFILTLFCCRAKKNSNGKSEYNPIASVSVPMEDEEKKYWDSLCNSQTRQANEDIKKNKIFYTHLYGMVDEYRSDMEMDSILSKYSIGIKTDGYYCTIPWNQQNCYGKVMEKEIQKRYGIKFIDSLRQVAEKIYVHKHRNDVFKFQDCDMTSRYPGTDDYSEFLENYKNDFFKTFKYPANFKFKNENTIPIPMPILFCGKMEE